MPEKIGIYIHIPFCRSKCDYCDFYSLAGREDRMDRYLKALLVHIRETASLAQGYQADTIYLGGGTPSYFGEKRLRNVLAEVEKRFDVAQNAEITVECNPDSVDKKMLAKLRRAGVNRLSLGVQSANDQELAAIHRPHTFAQAAEAVAWARQAKLKNLSLDLIYGLPGQDLASWQETVERAVALQPEHLSCYGLKLEEGTPLWGRAARGEGLPDGDQQADMYLWMVQRLAQAGYKQYEISNFARPGFQSRHNLKYWIGRPYIGLGPGAHSDFGGRRYSFVRDLDAYVSGVLEGGGCIVDSSDLIPQRERGGEYLMLRLRTTRGIEEWEYRREFFMNFDPIEQKLEEFERHGWAARQDRRWYFTPKGFLVSNQLIGSLLEAQEDAALDVLLPKLRQERESAPQPPEKPPRKPRKGK
ncbi:radical SAM family heme chaperone HemW [Pseudoflavonifractor sp. 524-17]|uniref:radical SAM family heme chaperone HemW n=1 Tax=Pseudoflavonifractor sp. 524-17 TaxID=2304577 RepID=UPI00137AF7BB|nr:radical SAM family heme chaperone HemW [Pseudoflavonifractor sp. 524-17]NCE65585.1 radical SAM family heme chaperone HemW [Pseudoflavonifractor sp. 524-17]